MGDIVSVNAKRDKEVSDALNSIWEEMENSIKEDETKPKFDVKLLQVKLQVPKVVELKPIKDDGYLKGNRKNTTYYLSYYYDRYNNTVCMTMVTYSNLNRTDGFNYYASSLIGSFLNECRSLSYHIDNAKFRREYEKVEMFIERINTMIVKYMEAGLTLHNIDEVLELSQLYDRLEVWYIQKDIIGRYKISI